MISFSGCHYPKFIILQCVRWYVSYAPSYRNIEGMMAERGFEIDHATLNRWVLHYTPLLEKKATLDSLNQSGWLTARRPFLIRQVKYLNNVVEQDHRHIKRITNPMGCFRKMHTASRTLAGIELMNMIKKEATKICKVY